MISRLQNRKNVLLLTMSLVFSGQVFAEMEYFSIAEDAVVMYDAPSLKAEKLYVASRYLPVEAVVNVDGWMKIRDSKGSLAWVEKKAVSDKRYVIVTAQLADVYQEADSNSSLVFQVQENVVVELLDSAVDGWVKVRHRDGQIGYIKVTQVWGS